MTSPYLTYCGNVHPAPDLPSWLSMVRDYAVPVGRAQRKAGHDFGLGTWWNADTAAVLATDEEALAQVRGLLAEHGLSIWTANVFPHGSFHGTPGKAQVYEPDWTREERVLYVRHVAEVVARLGSDLELVPLSTLPLGYRPDGHRLDEEESRLMARNLVRVASHLHAMEQEHGER